MPKNWCGVVAEDSHTGALFVAALWFEPRVKRGGLDLTTPPPPVDESLKRESEVWVLAVVVVVGTAEPRLRFSMPLVALFEFK